MNIINHKTDLKSNHNFKKKFIKSHFFTSIDIWI